jgi:hypothetical protein
MVGGKWGKQPFPVLSIDQGGLFSGALDGVFDKRTPQCERNLIGWIVLGGKGEQGQEGKYRNSQCQPYSCVTALHGLNLICLPQGENPVMILLPNPPCVKGQADHPRFTSKHHLLRYARPSSLRRTSMCASLLGTSQSLHLMLAGESGEPLTGRFRKTIRNLMVDSGSQITFFI